MNYAKKIVIFIPMHIFSYGILDKIRRLHKIHILCAFIFLYSDTMLKNQV